MGLAQQLNWKNVKSDGIEKALALAAQSGRDIGSSIQSAGDTLEQYAEKKTDTETDAFIAELMAMGTDAERQAAIAAADESFLDLGRVAERTYELGADERALATQLAQEARAAEAEQRIFDRDVDYDETIHKRDVAYEERINEREIKEAKELLKAEHERDDFITMMTEKREDEVRLYEDMRTDDTLATEFKNSLLLIEDEYKKNQELADLEFTRARSLITQEAQLKKQAALAEQTSLAAREQALADIESEKEQKLKEIEEREETKRKEIELKAKNEELKLKDAIKQAEKQGTGLEKSINRATMNGTLSNEDIDFHAADKRAFGKMEELVLGRDNVTKEEFDTYVGDEVNWNDNLLGFAVNPNDFSFTFRGVRETFGKKSWLNTGNIVGAADGWGWGGTSDRVVNALEAAIMQSENDKVVHDAAFKELTKQYKKKNIVLTKGSFEPLWRNFISRDNLGYAPATVDGFIQSLIPPEDKEGAVPGSEILLYKQ